MGLTQYNGFFPGDNFPAENANSVDPENYVLSDQAGSLICGSSPSSLTDFQSLGSGLNNGKFSVNIDGTYYYDIAPDFLDVTTLAEVAIRIQSAIRAAMGYVAPTTGMVRIFLTTTGAGSWTVPADFNPDANTIEVLAGGAPGYYIGANTYMGGGGGAYSKISNARLLPGSSIDYNVGGSGADTWFGNTAFAASLVAAKTGSSQYGGVANDGIGDVKTDGGNGSGYTGGNAAEYGNITWDGTHAPGSGGVYATNPHPGNPYGGGGSGGGSAGSGAQGIVVITYYPDTSIVSYDTDHFVITSPTTGFSSVVNKLLSPSSGTDISGNGTLPYLDGTTNATSSIGASDSYLLTRLNGEKVLNIPARFNDQTGTAYTLAITDGDKYVRLTNSSAITLTIPAESSINFTIGTRIKLLQGGAGQVTISPDTGVTLNSLSSYTKIAGQNGVVEIVKTDTDTWQLSGDLSA